MADCSSAPAYSEIGKDSFTIPGYHPVDVSYELLGKANEVMDNARGLIETCKSYADTAVADAASAVSALNSVASMSTISISDPTQDLSVSIPDIQLYSFELTEADAIPDPYFPFEFSESLYGSPLLDAIAAKLEFDVENGGTGLNADVEAAMYARESERDQLELQDSIDRISNDWSKRRCPIPNGLLAAGVHKAYVDYQNRYSDKSRKIAEDSLRIAIENTRWAGDKSVELENVNMTYNGGYYDRKLRGALGVVDAGTKVFDSYVKKFIAHYEGEKARATAYDAFMDAQGTYVDSFAKKAQAEASVYGAQATFQVGRGGVYVQQNQAIGNLRVEAAKAAAQMASHIAAGALSALHASASASGGASTSFSGNVSNSSSSSEDMRYSETSSINTNNSMTKTAERSSSCMDWYAHEDE